MTEVIATVIKDAPNLDALLAGTPPRLRALLERCLDRDVKTRLRDIGEARVALGSVNDPLAVGQWPTSDRPPSPARPAGRELVAWGLAALAVVALGVLITRAGGFPGSARDRGTAASSSGFARSPRPTRVPSTAPTAPSFRSGRPTLLAQPFDLSRRAVSGSPVAIARRVQTLLGDPRGVFSASDTGTLLYQDAGAEAATSLAWFDRRGQRQALVGEMGTARGVFLSPDNQFVTVGMVDVDNRAALWRVNLSNNQRSRLTYDTGLSPNERWITYQSTVAGGTVNGVFVDASPGGGRRQQVADRSTLPLWSADGTLLYFAVDNQLSVVDVTEADGAIHFGPPRALMPVMVGRGYSYDVAKDGRIQIEFGDPEDARGATSGRRLFATASVSSQSRRSPRLP